MANNGPNKPAAVHILQAGEKLPRPTDMLVGNVLDVVLHSRFVQWSLGLVESLGRQGIMVTVNEAGCSVAPAEKVTDEIRRDLSFAKPWLLEFEKWKNRKPKEPT